MPADTSPIGPLTWRDAYIQELEALGIAVIDADSVAARQLKARYRRQFIADERRAARSDTR